MNQSLFTLRINSIMCLLLRLTSVRFLLASSDPFFTSACLTCSCQKKTETLVRESYEPSQIAAVNQCSLHLKNTISAVSKTLWRGSFCVQSVVCSDSTEQEGTLSFWLLMETKVAVTNWTARWTEGFREVINEYPALKLINTFLKTSHVGFCKATNTLLCRLHTPLKSVTPWGTRVACWPSHLLQLFLLLLDLFVEWSQRSAVLLQRAVTLWALLWRQLRLLHGHTGQNIL